MKFDRTGELFPCRSSGYNDSICNSTIVKRNEDGVATVSRSLLYGSRWRGVADFLP